MERFNADGVSGQGEPNPLSLGGRGTDGPWLKLAGIIMSIELSTTILLGVKRFDALGRQGKLTLHEHLLSRCEVGRMYDQAV